MELNGRRPATSYFLVTVICALAVGPGCAGDREVADDDLGETAQDVLGSNLAGNNLAGVNLAGCNLAGTNLAGMNLGGANLAGNNLAGNNLAGTNLAGNNLAGSNLAGSNLAGSNLAGNNLAGNNLAGSNLAGSNLGGSSVVGRYPGLGCPKPGTVNLGTDLTAATVATDIHGPVTNQLLYSGEDLFSRTSACVVSGFGSTALAKLISQNGGDAVMYAAIRPLTWGFTTSWAVELTAWEVVVWGSARYSVFVLAAPPTATHTSVAGFIKAVWRWAAPPSKTLQIGAIGGGEPVVGYPGMMDAGAKVVAGTITEKAYIAGELTLITATTNNISVTVDFASWVRKRDNTGLMLANVTTPSGPTHGEAAYVAMEEPDGTIRIGIRGVSAAGIIDGLQQLGTAYSTWQSLGGTKPAPKRCAGALFLHSVNNTESDWQSKCDNGTTWAAQTSQTTGYTAWSAVGGTATPYNTYMTIQGPATTPYVTCRPTDIVSDTCPASSLLPVISETFVHMWEPAFTNAVANTATYIAAGGDDEAKATCARRTDGTVWCWGNNTHQVLVDGIGEPNGSRQIASLGTSAVQLTVGGNHACARKTDGTVWCWGKGWAGMLGNGTWDSSGPSAVQVKVNAKTVLTGITAIDTGRSHSCALKGDGSLWCWGYNANGELGTGDTVFHEYAVQVGTAKNWMSFAAGAHHNCAINSAGALWCWGLNDTGQLGTGNTISQSRPVQIAGAQTWSLVGASNGDGHTCARRSDATLWCWGKNENGQLGIGNTAKQVMPTKVPTLTGITELGLGKAHSCARKLDNTVWCWGANNYGQLGDGTTTQRTAPVAVTSLENLTVQLATTDGSNCARLSDGSIRCWGQNDSGNNASGTWSFNAPTQQVTALGTTVSQIATRAGHACAVKTDGTAWCWGKNFDGQLGNGTQLESATPVQVRTGVTTMLTGVAQIDVGQFHSCARKTDSTVWCWGAGMWGRLGNGSDLDSSYAIQSFSNVAQVALGDAYTCARRTDGTAWCWGAAASGELGTGTSIDQYAPAQVVGLTGVAEISAEYFTTCARKTDGTVWCWGYNGWGTVGDGTNIERNVPTRVSGLTGAVALSRGQLSACASKSDGTTWCWGQNDAAQLGDGTTDQVRWTPVQMTAPGTGVAEVRLGDRHACVRKTDGTLWCWGENTFGEVGIGSLTTSLVAVTKVTTGVASISLGRYRSCMVKTSGTAWCWGENTFGEVGNGSVPHSSVPLTALW